MTAYTQSDRRSLLLERRRLYEAEVAKALLDEEPEEREERLHLVRACQPMLVAALRLPIYDPEKYRE